MVMKLQLVVTLGLGLLAGLALLAGAPDKPEADTPANVTVLQKMPSSRQAAASTDGSAVNQLHSDDAVARHIQEERSDRSRPSRGREDRSR